MSDTVRYETWCYSVLWFTVDVFCFRFLDKFDACMIEKSTVMVIYIHHRVKWIVFAVPIEYCDALGIAIFNKKYL